MAWAEYLLAAQLLTAPADASELQGELRQYAPLRPALQRLAIHYEILDPREVRYVLTRTDDFPSDLRLLRRRYDDLADAPPLHDCERFPQRDMVNELLSFNRAYRQYLCCRQPVDLGRWWEFRAALQETEYLYQVWDTLRDARCEYYYVTVRRRALKKLRELLCEDSYYKAQLPPHVPLWRFQDLD